jgi:hypothetical protein
MKDPKDLFRLRGAPSVIECEDIEEDDLLEARVLTDVRSVLPCSTPANLKLVRWNPDGWVKRRTDR